MSTDLVSRDRGTASLPLICHSEYTAACLERIRQRLRINTAIVAAYLGLCSLLALLKGSSLALLPFILIGLTLLIYLASEQRSAHRRPDLLIERARFIAWLARDGKFKQAALACVFIVVTMGLLQTIAQTMLFDEEVVFLAVGALSASLDEREYWRLISGGFLHASVPHYLNNAAMFCVVAPLYYRALPQIAIPVFLGSMIFGNIIEWKIDQATEGVAGISGGVLGLLGGLIAASLKTNLITRSLAIPLAVMCILTLGLGASMGDRIAHSAHLAGLLLGSVITLLFIKARRLEEYPEKLEERAESS